MAKSFEEFLESVQKVANTTWDDEITKSMMEELTKLDAGSVDQMVVFVKTYTQQMGAYFIAAYHKWVSEQQQAFF